MAAPHWPVIPFTTACVCWSQTCPSPPPPLPFCNHNFVFFFFFLFRAVHVTYGRSHARGWIRASPSSLCHSSWQQWILNSLSEARDQTCIFMNTCRVHYCWATVGTLHNLVFKVSGPVSLLQISSFLSFFFFFKIPHISDIVWCLSFTF